MAALLVAVAQGSTRLRVDAAARAVLGKARAVVGAPGQSRPLVLDGEHVYQHKLFACEERLVTAVRARLGAASAGDGDGDGDVDAALAAVVADAVPAPTLEQQAAVRAAVQRRLAVVSGGPGTGKTTIVLALVRTLVRLGVRPPPSRSPRRPARRPTAWPRRSRAGLLRMPARTPADEALLGDGPPAETLHRRLGYSPASEDLPAPERSRLPHAVVIVDEGSMVDSS